MYSCNFVYLAKLFLGDMGYKSELCITIKKEDFDNAPRNFLESVEDAQVEVHDQYVLIYFTSVKWSNCFGDVKIIEDYIKDKFNYFLRVGEDWDDVEERITHSSLDHNPIGIHLSRIISW